MEENFKQCSFCGSTKLKIEFKTTNAQHFLKGYYVERHTYSVRCNSCHTRGSTIGGYVLTQIQNIEGIPDEVTNDEMLRAKAISAWNERKYNGL